MIRAIESVLPQLIRNPIPKFSLRSNKASLAIFKNFQNTTPTFVYPQVRVLDGRAFGDAIFVRHFSIKKVETHKAPKAIPYSQAVVKEPFMFVSGQLPADITTNQVIETKVENQTRLIFKYIEEILGAEHLTFNDVVRVEIFLKNAEDFKIVNDIYLEKFTGPVKPARQTITAGFVKENALVEISVIAARK